jgi:hypothetical protein
MQLNARITGLVLLLAAGAVRADVPEAQRHEVQHLLDFVAASPCTLIRNGSRHDAAEAVAHMRRKYAYFRDEIHTTEEFIAYAASRSTLSGRPYTVECPGRETIRSSQWLLRELRRYRLERR